MTKETHGSWLANMFSTHPPIAERIKALAFEHKVPVIENKPLARALLATAHVGQMIPAELYAAVAEVLAFVIRQRALAAMRWKGSALA